MKKIRLTRIAITVLFSFVMVGFLQVAVQAGERKEGCTLTKQIQALQKSIREAQAKLRKLNEEGGDQSLAQELMERIVEMRLHLQELKQQLEDNKSQG